MLIKLNNLGKSFDKEEVLKDINISFSHGNIYGIVGRNGSGKSVLFKCIAGLLKPSEGEIVVDDKILGKDMEFIESMGILIESPGLLSGYSAYQNLRLIASIKGLIGEEEIRESLKLVGLDPFSKKKVKDFSMGMKQRLGIAMAIMEDPELLILDEPLSGLDNKGVGEIRKLIIEMKEKGKLILLCSHNPEDINILADEVYEMNLGKLTRRKDPYDRNKAWMDEDL